MVKNQENMKMKMGGLGIVSSFASYTFVVRRETTDLLAHAAQGSGGANKRNTNMKKLMVAATAALCAAVGFADGIGGIQSQNIVGYNTVTIKEEWTILSCNFDKVSGGSMTINEAIQCTEGMVRGNQTTADQIQVQDGNGGYTTYFLSDGHFVQFPVGDKYFPEKDGKWFKYGSTYASNPTEDTIASGTAFWYHTTNTADKNTFDITVAGAAPGDPSKSIIVDETWEHIANPYPFALAINSISYVDGMKKGSQTTADQIQVQDGNGGYTTYFLSDGHFVQFPVGDKYFPEKDGKWFKYGSTYASNPTEDLIPVGKGAWYYCLGEGKFIITIRNPIAK